MAGKHPYMSGGGALLKAIQHLRRSLPGTIDASVLKKLGLAPKNESYLISILQFIGVISDDGTPTTEARAVFTQHDDSVFAKKFSEMVKKAYAELFKLHGDEAWTLVQADLVTYFRQTDQTSAVVGTRQATTFQALSAISGYTPTHITRVSTDRKEKAVKATPKPSSRQSVDKPAGSSTSGPATIGQRDFGLTVRIEINLPASGDQETYDRIFKSIRENLING